MARKKRVEEHENLERWLLSYSDFITLLFALFVVLFAITNIDLKKLRETSKSIRFGFAVLGTGGSGAPPVLHGPAGDSMISSGFGGSVIHYEKLMEVKKKIINDLLDHLTKDTWKNGLELKMEDRGLLMRFSAGFFFQKGDATLQPPLMAILDKIAPTIKALNYKIKVEGHTNSLFFVPKKLYPSNWEFSSMRAANVARYLVEKKGFLPHKVFAVGYAEYHPIVYAEAGNGGANERIDIVIVGRGEEKT